MKNALVLLLTAIFLNLAPSSKLRRLPRKYTRVVGRPPVIGRDNMKLALTFTLQGEEVAAVLTSSG